MDKVYKPISSQCYITSSELFYNSRKSSLYVDKCYQDIRRDIQKYIILQNMNKQKIDKNTRYSSYVTNLHMQYLII
jgi:hypothetical protein